MARVGTPKEKIEKDNNSQSNRTNEIPFRVHQTFSLLNSLITPVSYPPFLREMHLISHYSIFNYQLRLSPRPFIPLRNEALKGEGFLKCLS